MFDPASIATAVSLSTAAFNNIKKAFAIGRDLEGMSNDLSRWMKASSDIEQAVKSTKNPPFYKKMLSGDSVEEAAMKSLVAQKTLENAVKAWNKYYVRPKATFYDFERYAQKHPSFGKRLSAAKAAFTEFARGGS